MLAFDMVRVFEQTITQALGPQAVVFALAAIGLNIHFGYTGLLNFGQVGFLAAGAYGMAIAIVHWDINHWLAMGSGFAFALVLALILGVPTLRLRADYLAIVTIAAAEIIRLLARSTALRGVTRGAEGLGGWAGGFQQANPFRAVVYNVGPFTYTGLQMAVVVFGWVVVLLVSLLVWQLMRSPWGRVLRAIREDEDAVRALGKNAYWYKLQALMLGGAIGGLAGMVQVIGVATVQPDTFTPPITFFIWTVLILGGAARVFSPIAGAVIFWGLITFTESALLQLVNRGWIPTTIMDTAQVGQIRFWIVGLGLMGLMAFRPQGIFGNREEMALDVR
jgi:branched-chain amino acid transport system permease protein